MRSAFVRPTSTSLVGGLVAAALLAACSSTPPANPTPIPDLPTPAAPDYTVQRGLVARGVEFSARVQPASSETLSFQTDGRVYKINVKEGSLVKQGDVLAELDLSTLKAQLEQEMIRLRTAESVLSNTMQTFSDTLRVAQLDVEQARLRYELSQIRAGGSNSVLNNDLVRLDKRIADIRESIRQAREQYNQAGAANAEKMLEDALVERERLVASLSDAERGQRTLEIESQILRGEVERAEINLRRQRGTVDPGMIEAVETARIAVEATQAKIANGSLVAPFDGEVGIISAKVGEIVSALSPLMVVARPGELELVGSPTEEQLAEISVGQPVVVRFVTVGAEPAMGTIAKVPLIGNDSGSNNQNRARAVRIKLPDGVELESGEIARISTFTASRENVLWIPPQGLRTFRARSFVVVKNADGTESRRDVKIGLQSADRVEIMDGLKEGEIVAAP
jgi:multidrug efflux pump subunit AcrA (membrane-fusion protein)